MGYTAQEITINNAGGGQWPIWKRRYYFVWWIGPYSKFVGIQIWRFRINFHYDNWGKKKWDEDNKSD